jgi:plasmid stability protein
MSVNLSIKDVPDEWAEELRSRAQRNHRSLQGELMAIIEAIAAPARYTTPADLVAAVRASGLQTPSESVEMIRAMRDGR